MLSDTEAVFKGEGGGLSATTALLWIIVLWKAVEESRSREERRMKHTRKKDNTDLPIHENKYSSLGEE